MRARLYNSSYNRPFDEQTQLMVRLETEAKLRVNRHEKTMREAMGEVFAEREREKGAREAKGRDASSVRKDPPRSKAGLGLKTPKGCLHVLHG